MGIVERAGNGDAERGIPTCRRRDRRGDLEERPDDVCRGPIRGERTAAPRRLEHLSRGEIDDGRGDVGAADLQSGDEHGHQRTSALTTLTGEPSVGRTLYRPTTAG